MKKLLLILIVFFSSIIAINAQSTINITTSGGLYTTEKWVNITTAINNGGTQVWGQGDGSYGNGQGTINEDITLTPGTYYVNCFDRYSDGWDGTLISVTAYGLVIGNNGGVSPSDSGSNDSTGAWETPADELEASFIIIVPAPPSCENPTATMSAITQTGATATWAAANGAASYDWEVVPTGNAQGTGVVASGSGETGLTASIAGLSSNTGYDFLISSDCTTDYASAVTFTTLPGCGDTVTFCYDSGSNDLVKQSELESSGNYITATVNSGSTENNYDELVIYDSLDTTGNKLYDASGDHTGESFESTTGFISVWVRADGSNSCVSGGQSQISMTFTCAAPPSCIDPTALAASGETATSVDLAWTAGDSETLWDIELVDVTASGSATGTPTTEDVTTNPYTWSGLTPENDYQVYLRADCSGDNSDTSDWVGPVSFTTLATCPAPTALAASGVTLTTVDLDWTVGDSETLWDIELVDVTASGSATGSPTTEDVTTNPYTLSGLTSNNDYQVYLRADCSGDNSDTSDWVGPVSFTTPCDAYTIPYNEGFETGYTNSQAVGGCLIQESVSGSTSWTANSTATTYNRSPRTGSFNAYLRYNNEDWMFIKFDLTAGTSYDFSMYARQDGSGSTNSNITVSYGDTAAAASMTNSIVAQTGIVNGDYQQILGSFTPSTTGTYHIGIKGYMNGSPWYISIDDISLAETPPCSAPTGLTAGSITTTSAVLSWTESGTASLYNVDVVAQGASQTGGSGTDSGVTNSYLKENLSSNTSYDFYVQADCGLDGLSVWSGPYNFTTLPGCGDTVYDTGGASGNYSSNEDYTITYTPDTGDLITLDFTSVDLENCCDTLRIYDGADTNATLLNGDIQTPQSFTSSTDAGLTIRFTSDSSVQAGGWAATISCFTPCNWNGNTSTDWADVSNWSTGAVPTSSDNVYIEGTFTNEPSISSTDAAAGSVIVATGNTLTIDETSSLTVSGDFTNSGGTVTLNSTADDFSSLIVTGTATGDITYNRYVNVYDDTLGGGWDLVCSPVDMTIADFITTNGANIEVLGDDYAFSQYDNALGQWVRYATDNSDTGSFTAGQGYSMATTAGATVAYTGTMETTSQSINIINNNGLNGVGRRWNLVSNPFPSYINGNDAAGTANFMDANAAVIDSAFLAVYGWNGSSYTIYNNLTASAGFSMAPGQAFWVAAANTTATALNFTAAMRTTTGTGDFVQGPQLLTYNVGLKLYNGDIERAATEFYFRDGLSLDLDPGYDAAAFNQSTKLSSRLTLGSQETAFGINAMSIDALQNTRVPLEILQNAGQAFTISMADMNLPEDIYVYLEDTVNGTLTSLKENDFELVAQSDLSGSDRFFIVFKSNSVLSSGDTLGINALNVFKANNDDFVTIAGITPDLGQLDVRLYSMLGQTVRQDKLNTTTATQRISTAGLASGLYMVQIKSGNQTTVKKVIIK